MVKNNKSPIKNERTLFINIIFFYYLFILINLILNFVNHKANEKTISLKDIINFFGHNLSDSYNIIMDLYTLIVFTFLVIYLIKIYRMDKDLKKFTDIINLIILAPFVITLLLLVGIIIFTPYSYENGLGYVVIFFIIVLLLMVLVVPVMIWLLIRYYLTRLEREGKAKFTPGLFNRKKPDSQKK